MQDRAERGAAVAAPAHERFLSDIRHILAGVLARMSQTVAEAGRSAWRPSAQTSRRRDLRAAMMPLRGNVSALVVNPRREKPDPLLSDGGKTSENPDRTVEHLTGFETPSQLVI